MEPLTSHFVFFMAIVLSIVFLFMYLAIELASGYDVGGRARVRSGNLDCWLFAAVSGFSSVGLLIRLWPWPSDDRLWDQIGNSFIWFFLPLSLYFVWQAYMYTLLTVKNASQSQVNEALAAALKKNQIYYEKQPSRFLLSKAGASIQVETSWWYVSEYGPKKSFVIIRVTGRRHFPNWDQFLCDFRTALAEELQKPVSHGERYKVVVLGAYARVWLRIISGIVILIGVKGVVMKSYGPHLWVVGAGYTEIKGLNAIIVGMFILLLGLGLLWQSYKDGQIQEDHRNQ